MLLASGVCIGGDIMKNLCPIYNLCIPRVRELNRCIQGTMDSPLASGGMPLPPGPTELDEPDIECYSPRRCVVLIVLGGLLAWGLLFAGYYAFTYLASALA